MDLSALQKITKNLKVLYVEDSLTARNITLKMMSDYFNSIDIASNGKEALELYQKFYHLNLRYYDIVITDLEMPIMDGQELSRIILEFNYTQEIVVISGVDDFQKVIKLVNEGITKFLSKPIVEEDFYKIIKSVADNIRKKVLQENENKELEEYNKILKQREDENKLLLESKLKELEEFSDALNNSALVMKTNKKGVIKYVNKHYCNLSGYSEEELIGQNVNIVNASVRPKIYYKKLWNTINNKQIYKTLFENKAKDGSTFHIETTISPILNINNDIVYFIAVSHDMTRLVNSLKENKKAQKAKADFFTNISHEMKTPLNSILGFSSLLKKRVKDDTKSLMMANTIFDTGTDLNKLVASILDMQKIQDNTLELIENTFDASVDILALVNIYKQKAQDKNQNLRFICSDEIPEFLTGSTDRVLQVIEIVLDNAIKFTQDGGIIKIELVYNNDINKLICTIQDNGIGIAKEEQKNIYKLQQLDATASRSHEGVGLGLNIAHNIMKIMKGTIELKSILDKGSKFTLEFPLIK